MQYKRLITEGQAKNGTDDYFGIRNGMLVHA